MEKQRMDRRVRIPGSGLLIFILILVLPAFSLEAQEDESGKSSGLKNPELTVQVQISPSNPSAGGSWTVTILTDHPISREVTIRPPQFPPSLILERFRTDVRNIRNPNKPDELSRWTAMEFLFTPQLGGLVTLGSFQVSV